MESKNKNAINANVKANEQILSYMDKINIELQKFDKSELKSSKGSSNDVYKKEFFANCLTHSEIKKQREKLRNAFQNTCVSIIKRSEENTLKNSLIAKFLDDVSNLFIKNDIFNLKTENFCSSNMGDTSKNSISKAIEIVTKSEFYQSLK